MSGCELSKVRRSIRRPVARPGRKTVLIVAGILVCVGGFSRAQTDAQPSARSRVMRLDQAGSGLWAQSNRANATILRVTVGGNPAGRLGVTFALAGGAKREFGTHLLHKEPNSLDLQIVDGGNANASGNLFFELDQKHSVSLVTGRGLLDGQLFAVQFGAQSPLRIDQNSMGWGEWASADSESILIDRAGYMEDSHSNAELIFFQSDGRVSTLSGRASPTQKNGAVHITLTGSPNTGEFDVKLGPKNQILSIEGQATIQEKSARVHFTAALHPLPAKLEILNSSLAQLKRVRGTWTQGDASSHYTAYVDDAWIRRIDVDMSQGEYGSGLRHVYFTKDQLVFYAESATRRKPGAAGEHPMDAVRLELSFDSYANLAASSKTVNGKPAPVEKFEITGAIQYAEGLRQAAEESATEAAKPD